MYYYNEDRKIPRIHRVWNILGSHFEYRAELLYKRPRIDYRISEYVVEYINKNVLKPRKIAILEYGKYYALSIKFFHLNKGAHETDCNEQIAYKHSEYNTENTKYSSYSSYTRETGRTLYLDCASTKIHENIRPKEYANIVYDMIGAFLVKRRYKTITKEIMDKYKTQMDYVYIENFKYPAAFKDQEYMNDEYLVGRDYDLREDYMKHYGEKIEDKIYEDERFGTFVLNKYTSYGIDKYKLNKNIISIIVYVETTNELKECLEHLYKIIDNINELGGLSRKIFLEKFEVSEDGLGEIRISEIRYEKDKHFALLYDLPEKIREEVGTKRIKVYFDENNVAIDAIPGCLDFIKKGRPGQWRKL
jgi:hypothetical protein